MLQKYTMLQNFIQNFIENKCFHIKKVTHNNDECFICFMPYEQNNPIKMLSEFSHISLKCKCNTNIHLLCLNNWIYKTHSCPICRTTCISLQEINLIKSYLTSIINIYVFIILIFNLYLCSNLFIYILFQIYLFVKL